MRTIFAEEFSRIHLGRRGEHLASLVVFNLSVWRKTYGEGVATLVAQLPGQDIPYPCAVLYDEDSLRWEITSADTSVAGKGKCELSYHVGDRVVKSTVFQTYIEESLAPTGEEIPEAYASWLDDVLTAGSDAVAAKNAIENMSASVKTLSENETAAVTKTTIDGHTHLTFSLPRGEKGEKGDKGDIGAQGPSPVYGVDYFTSEEKTMFHKALKEECLGDIETALDGIIALQNSWIGGEGV